MTLASVTGYGLVRQRAILHHFHRLLLSCEAVVFERKREITLRVDVDYDLVQFTVECYVNRLM